MIVVLRVTFVGATVVWPLASGRGRDAGRSAPLAVDPAAAAVHRHLRRGHPIDGLPHRDPGDRRDACRHPDALRAGRRGRPGGMAARRVARARCRRSAPWRSSARRSSSSAASATRRRARDRAGRPSSGWATVPRPDRRSGSCSPTTTRWSVAACATSSRSTTTSRWSARRRTASRRSSAVEALAPGRRRHGPADAGHGRDRRDGGDQGAPSGRRGRRPDQLHRRGPGDGRTSRRVRAGSSSRTPRRTTSRPRSAPRWPARSTSTRRSPGSSRAGCATGPARPGDAGAAAGSSGRDGRPGRPGEPRER